MEILIIRHPNTIDNVNRVFPSREHGELSKEGKKSLEFFKNINIKDKKIYSSPMKRCLSIANVLSDDVIIDNRLLEIDFGDFSSLTYLDIEKKYPDEAKKWMSQKLNYKFPNGESYIDLKNRLKSFFNDLKSSSVIVSHAGAISMMLYILCGIEFGSVKIENSGIIVLEYNENKSVIKGVYNEGLFNSWK